MISKILTLTILITTTITSKTYNFKIAQKTLPSDSPKSNGKDTIHTTQTLLTLTDSPGQWQQKGISPLTYPTELLKNLQNLHKTSQDHYTMYPKALLQHSIEETKIKGSSSVTVISIDNHNTMLRGVNIGSNEYIIYRKKVLKRGRAKYRYTPRLTGESLMEEFNVPKQVGVEFDSGRGAVEKDLKIHGGELVVVFSDGVSANLFKHQLMKIINASVKKRPDDVDFIAEQIVEKAFKVSIDESVKSPFSELAKVNGIEYLGGRIDDISVIVAEVVEVEN